MVITLQLQYKENKDQQGFTDACFEGAIYKLSHTRKQLRVPKNVYTILKLTPIHTLRYIYS